MLNPLCSICASGPASRRLRAVLVIAAAPTLLTVLTAQLGVWDPANALRAMLALPLGIVIGGLVSAFASRDLR